MAFLPKLIARSSSAVPRPEIGTRIRPGFLVLVVLLAGSSGCAGISATEARFRNTIRDRRERFEATRGVSEASAAVLERSGIPADAGKNPALSARALEAKLQAQPDPDGPLALAELSYRAGLQRQTFSPSAAIDWYREAAILASLALGEAQGTHPELAAEIHNRALARLIRIAQSEGIRTRKVWRRVVSEQGLSLGSSTTFLDPERVADVRLTGDLQVTGLDHVYRFNGLGVPLVAHRVTDPKLPPDTHDQLMPREIRTAATAVVLPGGGFAGGEWRQKRSTLVFFDPAQESAAVVGSRSVTLARDLSTPLAMQVARVHLSTLEWNGLFQSDFTREGVETGLYILRPYQPGKIPVVFVHGLVSSPRAFIQTINELENDPILSARYQFWVFMYPTGLPVPASAVKLRESLAKTRDTLDPAHADGALDRMVFVGHSMGGLLSKMMTQDSGLELWNATVQVPYEKLQASPSLEKTIGQALVYQRVPNVSRVVFIASPHRGSPIANEMLGRVVSSFIRRPAKFDEVSAEMREIYGRDVISPELRGQPLNAIGNLRTDSPILAALNRIPINPSVPYHSIIPQIGGGRVLKTDGVVEYSSSHLDGATSELIVSGFHSAQQKPEVTAELRRILLVHLGPDGVPNAADGTRIGVAAPASRKL